MTTLARLTHDGSMLLFECPGCEFMHGVHVKQGGPTGPWDWNGSLDLPTLRPSIKVRWDYGEQHQAHVCHSFVTDGRINFLGDCTHALAGQTVDLPELDESPSHRFPPLGRR